MVGEHARPRVEDADLIMIQECVPCQTCMCPFKTLLLFCSFVILPVLTTVLPYRGVIGCGIVAGTACNVGDGGRLWHGDGNVAPLPCPVGYDFLISLLFHVLYCVVDAYTLKRVAALVHRAVLVDASLTEGFLLPSESSTLNFKFFGHMLPR